jgi:hypothetical protein
LIVASAPRARHSASFSSVEAAGDHARAHDLAQLDGREPGAAGRAQHQQGLAALHARAILQGVLRGAVRHHERSRGLHADAARHGHQAVGVISTSSAKPP